MLRAEIETATRRSRNLNFVLFIIIKRDELKYARHCFFFTALMCVDYSIHSVHCLLAMISMYNIIDPKDDHMTFNVFLLFGCSWFCYNYFLRVFFLFFSFLLTLRIRNVCQILDILLLLLLLLLLLKANFCILVSLFIFVSVNSSEQIVKFLIQPIFMWISNENICCCCLLLNGFVS